MSIVYLAMDKNLNKQWAVKEIRKHGSGKNAEIIVNSLLAEANLMKRLDHPSLPRIVDIIDNGKTIYVIMDYIEGESLDKVLKAEGPQSEEDVINWAKQLCDALSYLHAQKPNPIIYRDMKPANVMLKPEGNIKIIDFGIAREYKEESLADTTVLGTKGYAPPEQYVGQTSPRSDIYALGMTMHHLLTGIDPRTETPYAPVRQWNPELSEGIEAIIEKCVQTAEENRYQSCAELLYDLSDPTKITKGYKRKQKRRLASFITAAALSVVMFIGGIACNMASININNRDYENLITVTSGSSHEEKVKSFTDAIAIYPDDTRAYLGLLEAYVSEESESSFTEQESQEFLSYYNRYKEGFDQDNVEFAQLNYQIGLTYFNYYEKQSKPNDFKTRAARARSYFEINHQNSGELQDFNELNISECFYEICKFYKDYIQSTASVKEASREEYMKLLDTIDATMMLVHDANGYEKLSLYNSVFFLLHDQHQFMVSYEVDQDRVLGMFDEVYENAQRLTVQKDEAKKLRNEILEYYEEFRNDIVTRYENAERR